MTNPSNYPFGTKLYGKRPKISQVNSILVRISSRCGETSRTFGKDITKFSNDQNLVKMHVTNDNQILNQLAGRCDEQTKQNRIKLFHLNIQSIENRNHLIQIRELVYDKKVDVLAISETCLNSSISNTELKYKVTKFTDWTGNAREEEVYVFIYATT